MEGEQRVGGGSESEKDFPKGTRGLGVDNSGRGKRYSSAEQEAYVSQCRY